MAPITTNRVLHGSAKRNPPRRLKNNPPGIESAPLLAFHFYKAAVLAIVLSGFIDTLDGAIARFHQSSSPKGAILDITSDRAVEFSIILGLFFVSPETRGLPCILMLGSVLLCITSFLVVGIFKDNESQKGFHYSPGMVERTEAFAFFIALILLPEYFLILSIVFSILVFLTAFRRIFEFISTARSEKFDVKEAKDKF